MMIETITGITIPEGVVTEMRVDDIVLWKKTETVSKVWYDFGEFTMGQNEISYEKRFKAGEIPPLEEGKTYIIYVNGTGYEMTAELGMTNDIEMWSNETDIWMRVIVERADEIYYFCVIGGLEPNTTYSIRVEYAD